MYSPALASAQTDPVFIPVSGELRYAPLFLEVPGRGCSPRPPLQTQDLLSSPFKSRGNGWEKLKRMTSLAEVKEKLRRLLARAVREDHRGS